MRNTIEGFNQSTLIKYRLTVIDAVFLRWMLSFIATGKTKEYKDADKNTFYWIKYSKVINDLPIIFKNDFVIKRIIPHLSSPKESDNKPLISFYLKEIGKGTQTFFRFNPNILEELEGTEMNSLFSEAPIQPKINPKDKDFHKVPANPNCIEILKTLKKIKENGKPLFINHILPTDKHHYNSTFEHFQDAMLCLYEGRFLTKYNLGKTDEWWRNKYKFYLNENEITETIRDCKGNWNQIEIVMVEAAKNYAKWFDIDTEVYNKDKLPRSINDWIFNAHTKTSMFYISLLNPPTSAREADAEKTFNNINPKIRSIFNSIYQNEWDGFTYWNKISNLVKWYKTYSAELNYKDTNCCYWLSGGLIDFINNYKEWLLEFTNNKPSIKNIGINNNTFNLYIKQKINEHGIEIEIPRHL